jgi:hypothetical protein
MHPAAKIAEDPSSAGSAFRIRVNIERYNTSSEKKTSSFCCPPVVLHKLFVADWFASQFLQCLKGSESLHCHHSSRHCTGSSFRWRAIGPTGCGMLGARTEQQGCRAFGTLFLGYRTALSTEWCKRSMVCNRPFQGLEGAELCRSRTRMMAVQGGARAPFRHCTKTKRSTTFVPEAAVHHSCWRLLCDTLMRCTFEGLL